MINPKVSTWHTLNVQMLFNAQKAGGGIICPYFLAKHHAEGQVELKNYKVLRAQNASAIAKGEEIQRSTTACAELGHSQKKEAS